ncbi:MAG: protein translocase subunit SecD [Thermoguttaceae bacterium]
MPFYQTTAFINTATFIGLVVASSLVGQWLAKALRVADYGWKFGVILFAILASAVVVIRGWPPKLGVDLGGGSILVYKVDETKTVWRPEKMDSLLTSISKRVNPGGQKEISVKSLGNDMVEIVMPSVSGSTAKEKQAEADEIRNIIRKTGALEFRIVATKRDNESLIEMAKAERKKFPVEADPSKQKTVIIKDPKTGKDLAKWCRVRDEEADKLKGDDAAMMVGKVKVKDDQGKEVEKEVWEVLVLSPENDAYNVTGGDVRDAKSGIDQETATPDVLFSFNSVGGAKFGRVTGDHVPIGNFQYRLAIVLDDVLETAPNIHNQITDNGQITGNFKQHEVDEIVRIINAGSLPAALEPEPVRDMTTEATLGAETIRQSTWAMFISSIVVPLFMLYYYREAGLIAVLVLAMNMLILVALMILIKAPFTLPALAGLALTVGMAVDNNVLIYERLREEIFHGAALRMAIRNSFHRVGEVIVDANITHLIAATVLWSVGTEQIKGFAVTFWLGAILSIWATMFVARVMFEVGERRRWIQKLHMLQWIGHTKIDFMAWFPACATFSVVITVLGLVIAVVRGQGLFDIDFTGGVSVQTVFQEKQDINQIRHQISAKEIQKELPDATVTPAHSQDEPDNQRFIIDTSNSKREDVEGLLKKLFGEKLVTLELTARPVLPEKPEEKNPEKSVPPTATKPEVKPSEPPLDKSMSKPAENKPSDAKPSANKPADTRPADAKPTENKPAEGKGKQSRFDLPSMSLVAMAGDEAVLFAQADSPPAKATSNPKSELKPEEKADAKSQAKSEVKAEPKAEAMTEPKAEAKPESKKEPKSQVKVSPEKITVAVTKVDSATVEATQGQPFQAVLALSSTVTKLENGEEKKELQPVRYDGDRLKKVVEEALEENKIPAGQVRIELSAPEGVKKSDRWDLKLAPSSEAKDLLTPAKFQAVLTSLESKMRTLPYFPIEDNIGSAVANDTRFWAVVALVSSWSLIILYLWIRFQGVAFGLAAVIALIHDVLVMLGAIAFSSYLALIPGLSTLTLIEPFKINLPIVAAFLTIIGYSVNDTIVVFDRIREIRGKSPTVTRQMVNDATNQTLSRTVLTSFTVMLVVVILYIFGGQAVHGFAFALIIGVLTGTYSSIYVAAPILLWLLHPKEMSAEVTPVEAR